MENNTANIASIGNDIIANNARVNSHETEILNLQTQISGIDSTVIIQQLLMRIARLEERTTNNAPNQTSRVLTESEIEKIRNKQQYEEDQYYLSTIT